MAVAWSCGPIHNNNSNAAASSFSESAQQIGDLMAGVDESGGSSGSYGMLESARARYAQWAPPRRWFTDLFGVPDALASNCSSSTTFGTCSSGTILRSFNGCSVGTVTFSGSSILTYSNTGCVLSLAGDYVTRVPNFTATGIGNGTLSETLSGSVGQKITKVTVSPASYSFTNDGIERKFTISNGSVALDFVTTTTSPITINGASRSVRVMSGGALQVLNKLSSVTCTYIPSGVAWSSTCNCAMTGSWSGSCSDGTTSTLTLGPSCGAASFTLGATSGTVNFSGCYGS